MQKNTVKDGVFAVFVQQGALSALTARNMGYQFGHN